MLELATPGHPQPYPGHQLRPLLLLLLLLLPVFARAQAPGWVGATPGSLSQANGTSTTQAVATDASGNVFVTGFFTGTVNFGGTLLNSAGGNDIFVAKYVPATGTWAWAASAGGTSSDQGLGIAVSGTSVYVTGFISNTNASTNAKAVFFGGSGTAAGTSPQLGASTSANPDIVLAKYTDNGSSATFNWSQVGGGTGGDQGQGVAVSGTSVYVTGYIVNTNANTNANGVFFGGSGITAGTSPQLGASTSASPDIVLAKYTDNGSTGTFGWSQVGGGTSYDQGYGVAVSTPTGGGSPSVYVTGSLVNSNASTNVYAAVFGGSGTTAGTSPQLGASTSRGTPDLVLAKYTDNGSTGTFGWSEVGGGTESDVGFGIAVSGTSVYVTGFINNTNTNANAVVFGGSGTTAGTSPQLGTSPANGNIYSDLVLAKYTDNGSTGAFGWSQVGGGTGTDQGQGVAVSGTSVYVTGSISNTNASTNAYGVFFGGSGTTAGTSPQLGASTIGNPDLLLAKYTDNGSTGTFNWSQVGGGTGTDLGYGVAVSTPAGGGSASVYAAGYVSSSSSYFGAASTGTLLGTNGSRAVLAAALDAGSSGSWQAVATFFNGGTSTTRAVATDASGNVFVTGYFMGQVDFGTTRLSSAGGNDIFVAKYVPATGTWAWAASAGGTNTDQGYGVAVSGTSVYVTGSIINTNASTNANAVVFGGSGTTAGTSPQLGASTSSTYDLVLAKYTDNGSSATFGWSQVGGGTASDQGLGVAVSGTSVYVTGYISNSNASTNANAVVFGGSGTTAGTSPQLGASTNSNTFDLVLAKYTDNGSTGTFNWSQVGGGTGNDQGYGVAVSGTSVYVTGSISNSNASTNANAVVFGGSGTTAGTSPQLGASTVANPDIVLAKYTDNGSTGTFGWSQVGGGTSYDQGLGVAVSGTSVYVTGSISNSNASTNANAVVFGGSGTTAGTSPQLGASTTSSTYDLVLAKYTDNGSTGAFGWSQVGGGTASDQGQGVAVSTPAGGGSPSVYVTGSIINSNASTNANAVVFGGSGTTAGTSPQLGASPSTSYDLVLAKYTDNGSSATFGWSQVGGGTGNDVGYGVAVSGTSVYAAGVVVPSATFGPTTLTTPVGGTLNVLASAVDNTPLPVTLMAFTAAPQGPAAVRLAWTTASEVSSARFEVQRSADGVAFITLGAVAAAGSSATTRQYAYLDAAAPSGPSYYRLRQVDQDGTSTYSPVRVVTLGETGLALYPNPAPGGAALLTGATPGAPVQVLDALGRVAATATVGTDGTVALGGLAPGLYVVRSGAGRMRLAVE